MLESENSYENNLVKFTINKSNFICYQLNLNNIEKIKQNTESKVKKQNKKKWINIEKKQIVINENVTDQQIQQIQKSQDQKQQEEQKVQLQQAQIQNVISLNKNKIPPTHFISIPFNSQIFIDIFEALKLDICFNVDQKLEKYFQRIQKIHLTILMLTLTSDEEQQQARKVFQNCKALITDILGKEDFKLQLDGLGFFSDKSNKQDKKNRLARVLFTKIVKNSQFAILKQIVNIFVSKFLESNLVTQSQLSHLSYDENSKLYELDSPHITIMKASQGESFPVSQILKTHKNIKFGEIIIRQIDLSTRFKFDQTGWYDALDKINFE